MRKTVATEVVVDDLTDKPIERGGWVLTGLGGIKTEYHFTSLTNLAEALLNNDDLFGLVGNYIRRELKERGAL